MEFGEDLRTLITLMTSGGREVDMVGVRGKGGGGGFLHSNNILGKTPDDHKIVSTPLD